MKALCLVLGLIILSAAFVLAQSKSEESMGGPSADKDDRDVIWSDPPDFDGVSGSSEIIDEYGLESELANDFLLDLPAAIRCVRWWGAYYEEFDGPTIDSFILRLYFDAGCLPEPFPFMEVIVDTDGFDETLIDGYERVFAYQADVDWILEAGLYWFSVQAGDHQFPPGWGRLAAEETQLCDTAFRSGYFAYPVWVPAPDVFGDLFDASQEFDDEPCGWEPPFENDTCFGSEYWDYSIERCTSDVIYGNTTQFNDDYDPSEPGPSCTGYAANGRDVVYYLDLEVGDVLDLSYYTVDYDASFYIVTDCSDMTSCVVGADNALYGDPEEIEYVVEESGRYYLILDMWSANAGGPFELQYTITGLGSCCFEDGSCQLLLEADCTEAEGLPQGGCTSCDPNPCPQPQTGACCVHPQDCYVLTEVDCGLLEDWYLWLPNQDCDPNPCPPIAVETTTWGSIKAGYR